MPQTPGVTPKCTYQSVSWARAGWTCLPLCHNGEALGSGLHVTLTRKVHEDTDMPADVSTNQPLYKQSKTQQQKRTQDTVTAENRKEPHTDDRLQKSPPSSGAHASISSSSWAPPLRRVARTHMYAHTHTCTYSF